jgi:hypothetical protein
MFVCLLLCVPSSLEIRMFPFSGDSFKLLQRIVKKSILGMWTYFRKGGERSKKLSCFYGFLRFFQLKILNMPYFGVA